jgi:hypothetical protein
MPRLSEMPGQVVNERCPSCKHQLIRPNSLKTGQPLDRRWCVKCSQWMEKGVPDPPREKAKKRGRR